MPNSNLPTPPGSSNPIPNEPFSDEEANSPYLSGPYSPLLLGEGLTYCGDYILSPTAVPAIPIGFLTAKGTLISALSCATPAPIALGEPGQLLTVDISNTDTGISWCNAPSVTGCVSCSEFTTKGSILAGSAPGAPVALDVGPDGTYLTADSTTPTGLAWTEQPYAAFTEAGQLVVSCSATCAIPLGGVQGDILYYDGNPEIGWAACQGDEIFVPQEGFAKGTLIVGSGANESGKLAIPLGADGYSLQVDCNCALGVKWASQSQYPQQTTGCNVVTIDPVSTFYYQLFANGAFPQGSTVYVALTGSWYGDDKQINGDICITNGTNASFPIPFDNSLSRRSRLPLALAYSFCNYDQTFPITFVFDKLTTNPACIYFQASAFVVKS